MIVSEPVVGEPHDPAVAEALDVEVVGAHVGDAGGVGRELGEHQRRGRRLAAELRQPPDATSSTQ